MDTEMRVKQSCPLSEHRSRKRRRQNCFHYLVVVVGGELMSKLALLAGVGVVNISSGKVIKLHTT